MPRLKQYLSSMAMMICALLVVNQAVAQTVSGRISGTVVVSANAIWTWLTVIETGYPITNRWGITSHYLYRDNGLSINWVRASALPGARLKIVRPCFVPMAAFTTVRASAAGRTAVPRPAIRHFSAV